MSVALRYAHDEERAGEIYNDSFLKIFRNIRQFDPSRSFKTWLRRIIIHTVIDHYRKELKYQNHVQLNGHEEIYSYNDVLEKLSIDEIVDMIQTLPHILRIVFNMYELEGYSHDEIAKKLSIRSSTSRSCLTRAKRKLRNLIAEKNEAKIYS